MFLETVKSKLLCVISRAKRKKKKKISKNAHNSKMVCLAEQDNRHHRNRNVSLKGTSPIQRRQCFIPLHPLLCHALYCPFEEYFQITDVNSFGAFEFQLYPVSEQQGRSFPQVHEPNQWLVSELSADKHNVQVLPLGRYHFCGKLGIRPFQQRQVTFSF